MHPLLTDGDGNGLLIAPYGDDDTLGAVSQQLQTDAETPRPQGNGDGGPIRRATDHFASIPATYMRRLIMSGAEASEAIRTRRDELYRNEFPILEPRFAGKCEECGTEVDTDADACPTCGGPLRDPDPAQKRDAKRLFESVNPAGESLRDVAKRAEEDQWAPPGVSTLVIEHEYYQATTGDLYEAGTIYRAEPTAIYRADPLALRPVVDADGHPGGWWWVCPLHREDTHDEPGRCPRCDAQLREVYFVEMGGTGDRQYYLREEVVTWSYAHPRLHGLDGLSPSIHVWLKQAILQMMDRYGAAFYDTESDRLPNQFMILHTSNADAWEAELAKARDEDDPYESPIFTNEYNAQDSVQPEVEVIDAMPDELLGQSEQMKETFKTDIRQAYGISDVHDSDLADAGGLNNEGLQLEVTDRSIASQQQDYREGWLDTLMKRLGFADWRLRFLPDTGVDADDLQDNLRAGAFVKQAGGDAEIVDGRLEVPDFEVELDDSDDPPSLQGAPNLPGVGSPVPDAGGGAGGDAGAPGPQPGDALGEAAQTRDAVAAIEQALAHVRAPDAVAPIEQKGEPVYSEDADVPANVQNRIEQAIRNYDFRPVESVSSATLQSVFEDRLTQPQGWSIDSLADQLQAATPLERDHAETVARTEATGILSQAREDAVADLAANTDQTVLHYWDGPDDESTTDICEWLKGETNPEYGGDPVPMDELRDLQREAITRFTDRDPGAVDIRAHLLHPNERHTHKSILESEVA